MNINNKLINIYIYVEREREIHIQYPVSDNENTHKGLLSPTPLHAHTSPRPCLRRPRHGVGWGGVNPLWVYFIVYRILDIHLCIYIERERIVTALYVYIYMAMEFVLELPC